MNKLDTVTNNKRTQMFSPRFEDREMSLMNPKNMRELHEAGIEISCPFKECGSLPKPREAEINQGYINLLPLQILADKYGVEPSSLYLIFQYARYLTSEVYILPNLFNLPQDETILRAKANVAAKIFKEDVFGHWAKSLVTKLVTAAVRGTVLKPFSTCATVVPIIFPTKSVA